MDREDDRAAEAPVEALDLRESISLGDNLQLTEALSSRWQPEPGSVFDSKGRVPIYVIRPGIGKGKGRHLYEANMLADNAEVFKGWKMYVDHQSPEAKAAGGLPRSLRDAGGIVKESFWDPDVPADPEKGYDQGAVVGLVKPTSLVKGYIEDDPEIVEASIHASATGVKPVLRDGQRCWLVEGINDRGSVDWVSEAGAGGRVVALMEAAYSDEVSSLEGLTDEQFRDWMTENRPNLKLAEAAGSTESTDPIEEADVPITPEALQEAIHASPNLLIEALQQSPQAQDFIRQLVEATLEEEKEIIRAEARADAQHEIALRDMRDEAHRIIAESKLPDSWQAPLKERFTLVEGAPTDALNVVDEVDKDGKIVKPAMTILREAVEASVASERERLREVAPTRVRGLGSSGSGEGGDEQPEKVKPADTGWGKFLRESAQVDPDKAYTLTGAGDDA